MQRQRVVFRFHCLKLGVNVPYGRAESFQCVVKACSSYSVQVNISAAERFEKRKRVHIGFN